MVPLAFLFLFYLIEGRFGIKNWFPVLSFKMWKREFKRWCCNCSCSRYIFHACTQTPKRKKNVSLVYLFPILLNIQHYSYLYPPSSILPLPPSPQPQPNFRHHILTISFPYVFSSSSVAVALPILYRCSTSFPSPTSELPFHGSLACSSFSAFQLCSKTAFNPANVLLFGF